MDTAEGLVNGTQAYIRDINIEEDYLCLEFKDTDLKTKFPNYKLKRQLKSGFLRQIGFLHRAQYPLRMAFAFTLHYCQGRTLQTVMLFMQQYAFDEVYFEQNKNNLSISSCFEVIGKARFNRHELYVGLSRVTNLNNLTIDRDILLRDIKIDLTTEIALSNYRSLHMPLGNEVHKLYYHNVEQNLQASINLGTSFQPQIMIFVEVHLNDINTIIPGYNSLCLKVNETRNFLIFSSVGEIINHGTYGNLALLQAFRVEINEKKFVIVHNQMYLNRSHLEELYKQGDYLVGDFNQELNVGLLQSIGTTKSGSSIDNFIDTNRLQQSKDDFEFSVVPCDHSHHHCIFISRHIVEGDQLMED